MDKSVNSHYQHTFSLLKEKIQAARMKSLLVINAQLLAVYWEIGSTILEQQQIEGWGAKIIDRLAMDLKIEFPDETGFSVRNLKYMRAFAEAYPAFITSRPLTPPPTIKRKKGENKSEIVQGSYAQHENNESDPIVQGQLAQLSWYHHITLLDKVKNQDERLFYIQKAIKEGWSRSVMVLQIENNLFQRQGKIINNFEETMPAYESDLAKETFKSPYIFDFLSLGTEVKEKELERGLVQHLKKFMLELGRGFAYVGNQYNLTVKEDEYFLDLLFYNINLRCYVVFELKVGDFKPEYAGKLNFYINTVDETIKGKDNNPTIGILLCKTPNDTVVKYALKGIETPLGVAEYEFAKTLPKKLSGELPSIKELEDEIEKEYEELKTPTQKKFDTLKEKLANLKGNRELEQKINVHVLQNLIKNSLSPFFEILLEKLKEFDAYFHSNEYYYQGLLCCINNNELIRNWKDEHFQDGYNASYFYYKLHGFKKGGVDSFDILLQLTFHVSAYWYGFSILGYDNQQPFVRKMYHEQLTKEDKQSICDIVIGYIIDEIGYRVSAIQNL